MILIISSKMLKALFVIVALLPSFNSASHRIHIKRYDANFARGGPHHHHGYGDAGVAQHSGYIPVENGQMFYWMFESRVNPETAPLVVWFTGGPGCSSELAIYYENGPFRMDHDGHIHPNGFSWNQEANLLFVDNPIGTGFSYADTDNDLVQSEEQVANDMKLFFQSFLHEYPSFNNRDLYLSGESYAGKYIPWVAHRLFTAEYAPSAPKMKLRGVAIGNGWVDPALQYPSYVEFAKLHNLAPEKMGAAETQLQLCLDHLHHHDEDEALEACGGVFDIIWNGAGQFNYYDIREPCTIANICYDFSPLHTLMATQPLKTALGVDGDGRAQWSECSDKVAKHLQADQLRPSEEKLKVLLDNGVHVLVYSGEQDFICNWIGGRDWVSALSWSGSASFKDAQTTEWSVSGTVAGSIKRHATLTFATVRDAGHMVPMNQPERALVMLKSFMEYVENYQH